jgi:hypothetical protein
MMQTIRPLSFSEILDEIYFTAADSVMRRAEPHADNGDWLFQLFAERAQAAADSTRGNAKAFADRISAYREAEGDVAAAPPMSEEDRVGAELELDGAATIGDLKRIRRAFALRNHPDLFRPGSGAQATSRMKIANMLIDRRRKEIESRR